MKSVLEPYCKRFSKNALRENLNLYPDPLMRTIYSNKPCNLFSPPEGRKRRVSIYLQLCPSNSQNWITVTGKELMTSLTVLERTLGKLLNANCQLFPDTSSKLRTTTLTQSQLNFFLQKKISCKKPTKMHTTQNPGLFVTYREGFRKNTKKNPYLLMKNHHSRKIQVF